MTVPTPSSRSILLVEDDDALRTRLARALERRGHEVRVASNGEDALKMARAESPEYAVVDLRMEGMSGLQVVQALKTTDPATRVVVLTGYGSIATALEAVRLGATHYLTKPASVDDLLAAFHRDELPGDASSPSPSQVPTLDRVEWEHIQRVLTDCGGNISQAARLLGVHRRSLQRKLLKYPVPR